MRIFPLCQYVQMQDLPLVAALKLFLPRASVNVILFSREGSSVVSQFPQHLIPTAKGTDFPFNSSQVEE